MSDIIGSILLVGITVIVALAFGLLLWSYEGPEPRQHTSVGVALSPGSGGWGTGDEAIQVQHLGGEPIGLEGAAIFYVLDGSTTRLEGTALGSAFSDGKLTVGETWSHAVPLDIDDEVRIGVVAGGPAETRLLSSSTLQAGVLATGSCLVDTLPPYGTNWAQVPPDVASTSSGDVEVTVTLADLCSAIDPTIVPHLHWCVAVSCSAFTDAGAMANVGSNRWRGTIPHTGSWAADALAGKSLVYHVAPVRDTSGNAGQTPARTDPVEFLATYTYPASHTATTGTVTDFAKAQSASDSGAFADLTEGGTTTPPGTGGPTKFSGTTATGSATNPNNVLSSNDVRASMGTTNGYIELSGFDLPSNAIGVTAVTIGFEGRKSANAGTNPTVRLDYKVGAGAYSTGTNFVVTNDGADADYTRVLAGAFTVADVEAMTVRLFHVTDTNRDVEPDHVFATVTYTTAASTTYSLSVQLDWTSVPSGSIQLLELRAHVDSPGDTFTVQVWDGVAWRTCAGTLASTTPATFTCTLLPAEWLAGSPRIRFVDSTPAGTTQGRLHLDYARVATA